MGSLKNSEQMLKFMNDLSHFSELFSVLNPKQPPKPDGAKPPEPNPQPHEKKPNFHEEKEKKDEKNPQSPTQGIADEFIERCLNNYFKNR